MTKQKKTGGNWQHADSVYGAYPHQAATGNLISMTGGMSKKRKGGRGMLTDVAVPVSLLLASNYLGRKQTRMHKKRVRFTRRRR